MKTRVIPIPQSRERDLSKALVSRYLSRVIRAPSVRSFALLGMTAWFAWLLLPKPPLLDGISFSQCVRDRNGKLLRVTLSADQKVRIWTPLAEISPDLIDATLRYEDKYYAHHPGVNPLALARCALDLLRFHRVTAGGSTITMQLARLRFHLHTRNISGKLEQIIPSISRNPAGTIARKSTAMPNFRCVIFSRGCKRNKNSSRLILFSRCSKVHMGAIKSSPRSILRSSGRLSEESRVT